MERAAFKRISDRFKITGSLQQIKCMCDKYDIKDIVQWEEDTGVVYQIIKENTDMFKSLDDKHKDIFLEHLLEEYTKNVAITDKVIEIIKMLATEPAKKRLFNIDDLQLVMIKHMNAQGFEVVPYTITLNDLQNCVIAIYQAYTDDTLDSIYSMIRILLNQYNYKCFITSLDVLDERESPTLYKDILKIAEFVIHTLRDIVIDTDVNTVNDLDEDEENMLDCIYNVYDEVPTNDDLVRYAYEYFPYDIIDLPREEAIMFMTALYDLTIVGVTSDDMYKLAHRILNRFNKYVNKQYRAVESAKESPAIIVNNMKEIAEIEYRIPNLMYLTGGEFEIAKPLVSYSFETEYKFCKKLIYVQQSYSNWYEGKLLQGEVDTNDILEVLDIDMINFNKLIISDED